MKTLLILSLFVILTCYGAKECEFAMRMIPGFSPLKQTDSNGKECRGNIELPFCKGYCKTSEIGTHGFPSRIQTSSGCTLVKTSERKVILDDCDDGASDDIKFIMIPHGTECACSTLPADQLHS